METLSYCNVKYAPGVQFILVKVKKLEHEISILFLFLSPFFSFIHISKTAWHMPTIYTPNNYSTIRDGSFFLGQSSMWAIIRSVSYGSKQMSQSLSNTSCCASLHALLKNTGCTRTFYYWKTALLSEMSIFSVRAACKLQSVRYGSKWASQSLFDITLCVHCCVCTATDVADSFSVCLSQFLCSRTVFLCFHSCLVSVLLQAHSYLWFIFTENFLPLVML